MVKFKKHKVIRNQEDDLEMGYDPHDEDEIEGNAVKKWYEDVTEDPQDFKRLSEIEISQLRNEARVVLENDSLHNRNKHFSGSKHSDGEWLHTMVSKGTSQDKIAASVVLIQNSPLHGLSIIKSMVNSVKARKTTCTKTMDVLSELFITDLLIPNRKLRLFEKRPLSLLEELSNGNLVKRNFYLKIWYFEDQLKNEYVDFIQAVIAIARDTVISNREKSVVIMQKLLAANPEQEALLLSSLVNKIGDSSPVVASKAITCLCKVLKEHPNMKTVVMGEVEKLLFRSNVGSRAQYYSICFLSQYILTKEETELANRLIDIYISFFKGCIKQGDVDSKLMSGLLIGIKRAFPFSEKNGVKIKEHIDTLYKMVHIAKFNVSIHALYLLFQVYDSDTEIPDRFYNALFGQIVNPDLSTTSQHAMFISLVFRAMSKDIQQNRIQVFIKRLLQICHFVPVPVACGILIMISHLLDKNKNLQSLTLVATAFSDEENEETDGEHYEDIKLEDTKEQDVHPYNSEASPRVKSDPDKKPVASWYHVANSKNSSKEHKRKLSTRNPLFLSGGPSVYTELVSLATHFHPTVALYANHLIEGKCIKYTGDPLKDFTLANFLDRLVFKNPKTLTENKKPVSKLSREGRYPTSRMKTLTVNSKEYLDAPEGLIPPDELFLYRHLKKSEAEGKKVRQERDDDDSDVSSVASDEFEGMMDQLMGGKEEIDFAEGIKKLPSETKKTKKRTKGEEDFDDDSEEGEEEEGEEEEEDEVDNEMDDVEDGDGNELDEDSDILDDDIDTKNEEDDEDEFSKIKDEFSDLDDLDDDEEVITFDGSDEDDFAFTMSDVENDDKELKIKKNKKSTVEGKKSKKNFHNKVFVPAEEFAQMLEDTGDRMAKYGSLANVSNKDNADMEQLKWEMNRNQWIHGHRDKRKKHGGSVNKKPLKKFKKR